MTRAVVLALSAVGIGACVAAAADDVVRARLSTGRGQAVVEVTIARGWHVNGHEPRDEFLIPTTVTLAPPAGMHAGDVVYPPPVERRLAFGGGKTFLLYEGTVRFTAALEGSAVQKAEPLRATLRYQACDDSHCLPPRTLELATAVNVAAASGESAGRGADRVARWVAEWGWALTFAWVALLGVALNLTPCVYPLISVTVAFFGGRGTDEPTSVRRALVYVVGICLSFSTLGVAAALTGSLFGAALQRPAVLGSIALVLVALAGSNFGLWQLRVPARAVQRLGRVGEGDLGALFMGLTMGVVAAPCIGPVVVALLLFVGAQQSAALGFALFFVLGLGMGAPYVGLAAAAGRFRRLPRAGPWLAWVEHLFGFLLLGLALYFAAPVLPDLWVRIARVVLVVTAGLVLGFLGPELPAPVRWPGRVAGVALVGVALVGLLGAETGSPIPWMPFSDDALARAVAARRPVLLDFEAEWCLPCREMERTTFRDAAVVRAAAAFAALRVDVTSSDERATELMERFKVAGVPTYVLLGPDGIERQRLVGFVGPEAMLRGLAEAHGG